jgi:DNA polymerase-3 subunit epsilon
MIASLLQFSARVMGISVAKPGHAPKPGNEEDPARSDKGQLLLDETTFVVFDTELTGLNARKDSIVSLGAVKMQGKRILLADEFYRLVEPRTALTAKSVVIHQITPSEAAGLPGIEALLPEFIEYCGDAVVVGHAVSIDLGFLNREMKHLYGHGIRNRAVDTARLYQWLRNKEENACAYHSGVPDSLDLFSLAKKYHIPVSSAHNALGDAFITAQLLQRLLHDLSRWGITKRDELLAIARP